MARTIVPSRVISRACVLAPVLCLLPACAEVALHPGLSDEELHARLAEHFPAGMTLPEVQARLDELEVNKRFRTFYDERPGGAPPQLLVRLYEGRGGFWVTEADQTVRWVDADFVFTRGGEPRMLERVETFRGSQRYFEGEPVHVPETPTRYAWGHYPLPPPPPAEGPVK